MKIGNRLLRVLAPLLLLFASSEAGAQETSYAQWVSVPMTVDIGEDESRPQLWLDMHARRFEDSTTTIFRPAVGWRFNKTIVTHAGYGFISTYADANGSAHEHRIWEQVILNLAPGARIKLQSRTRFEQRMSHDGGNVALRLREFVRVGWHVAEGSPFQILVWDEVFVGLNEANWGPPQGYDQNRLFVGPGVNVTPLGGRLELGYLHNHLKRNPENQVNHSLYAQVVIGL